MASGKRMEKLDEKIYLSTFSRPRHEAEISYLIYREEKKTIYPIIKELKNREWIEEVNHVYNEKTNTIEFKKSRLTDFQYEVGDAGKRANQRKYFYGTIKPIYERLTSEFEKRLERKLNSDEEKRLKKFIDSDDFRILTLANPRYLDIRTMVEWMSYHIAILLQMRSFLNIIYHNVNIGKINSENEKNIFDGLGPDLMNLWITQEPHRDSTAFLARQIEFFGGAVLMAFDDFVNIDRKNQEIVRKNVRNWYEQIKKQTMKNINIKEKCDHKEISLKK